jgi:hypothetical protein
MASSDALDKLDNMIRQAGKSNKARNDADVFVREVSREAKNARLNELIPQEQIEALAAEGFLRLVGADKSRLEYPFNVLEFATNKRNHKLMLKLLRHPNDTMRSHAADQFQILFAMIDGYYDEASAVVNQLLLTPTEIPEVKYALLRDVGRPNRRGLPREIGDTARRLIHDIDQVVSYHALRLLTALNDLRDWKAVLDRMMSLVGEDDEASQYFLSAGVEYLWIIIQHEPGVVEWIKSLLETYPQEHMAITSVHNFVLTDPDTALAVGLINKKEHQQIKGG